MSTSSRARLRATSWSYGLLAAWLCLSACSEDAAHTGDEADPDRSGTGKQGGGGDQPVNSGSTAGGVTVIDAPPLHIAANDVQSRAPMDATPTPDGQRVYYTALGIAADGSEQAGVFATDAAGGAAIETLTVGSPLTAPVGISINPDGDRLFLADSAWNAGERGAGAIVALPTSGGVPSALAGTEGYVPRGLVIADVSDETWLYFTGVDPERGEPGVFRTALAGGTVQAVASGAPFVDPAGVAVASDGTVYVIDALASSDARGQASVVRVRGGEAERMIEGLGVGFPAGIATTLDASMVLVSGLDPVSRTDRVFVVNAMNGELSVIEEPFASFSNPAGLHRAHDTNVFAWADSAANDEGTVYVVEM
jgi:sugar lactone lactonase YvrE